MALESTEETAAEGKVCCEYFDFQGEGTALVGIHDVGMKLVPDHLEIVHSFRCISPNFTSTVELSLRSDLSVLVLECLHPLYASPLLISFHKTEKQKLQQKCLFFPLQHYNSIRHSYVFLCTHTNVYT